MAIVQKFAGYTLGGADTWRRAVGKKDDKLLQSLKQEFIYGTPEYDEKGNLNKIRVPGCIGLGYTEELGEYLFKLMEYFSGYGFNRAHSAAYALNAYHTMFLKTYFPAELMRAALSSESDLDKVSENLKECKRLGIRILPPDINLSDQDFKIELDPTTGEKCIRYGLSAIKQIGPGHVIKIKSTRPFTSMEDFVSKAQGKIINRRHIWNLILGGAFDQFNQNRYEMMNHYNFDIRKFEKIAELLPGVKLTSNQAVDLDETTWDKSKALEHEKELLGAYVTGHPYENLPYTKWEYIPDKAPCEYGGAIRSLRVIKDKNNNDMAFFTLETAHDMREVTVFSKVWAKHGTKIKERALVIVRGTKEYSRDNIMANEVVSATKSALAKTKKQQTQLQVQMPVIDTTPIYEPASQQSPYVPLPQTIDLVPLPDYEPGWENHWGVPDNQPPIERNDEQVRIEALLYTRDY